MASTVENLFVLGVVWGCPRDSGGMMRGFGIQFQSVKVKRSKNEGEKGWGGGGRGRKEEAKAPFLPHRLLGRESR